MTQLPEMRFDPHDGVSGLLRPNSRDYREEIKIRMSAPGMGIRASRLRLLSPGCESERHHVPPRL